MIIGLDLDGVVADSLPLVVKALEAHLGKKFEPSDNFDLSKFYQVPREEISELLTEGAEGIFGCAPMIEGAAAGIASLQRDGHEIIYITARRKGREEEVTREWLNRHGLDESKVFCVSGGTKTEAIQEQGVQVFVDDFLKNAEQIAAIGIPVLLLDAYYNQREEMEHVIRCYSWEDILKEIADIYEKQNAK